MMSTQSAAIPYLSDIGLDENTDWLAITVSIEADTKSYASSVAKVKEISEKLEGHCEQSASETCNFVASGKDYEDLAPRLELAHTSASYTALLVKNIVLELNEDDEFWHKMGAVATYIDKLLAACEQFSTDSAVKVRVGQ